LALGVNDQKGRKNRTIIHILHAEFSAAHEVRWLELPLFRLHRLILRSRPTSQSNHQSLGKTIGLALQGIFKKIANLSLPTDGCHANC